MSSDDMRGFRADLNAVVAAIDESSLPPELKAVLRRAVNRVIEALTEQPWDARQNFEGMVESMVGVCAIPKVSEALEAPTAKTLRETIMTWYAHFRNWVDVRAFYSTLPAAMNSTATLLTIAAEIKP